MDKPFVYHAYLVIDLKENGTPYPEVIGVGIFSSPGPHLTTVMGVFRADVMVVPDDSYHEAHEKLVEYVMTAEWLAWARPWIDPSYEAHMTKLDWQKK